MQLPWKYFTKFVIFNWSRLTSLFIVPADTSGNSSAAGVVSVVVVEVDVVVVEYLSNGAVAPLFLF